MIPQKLLHSIKNCAISKLGLGTVKFGRNTGVKYPTNFELPSDQEIINLLTLAQELGINLLDTAPAYGSSEERIGKLLPRRKNWVISTKVGENFINHKSYYDFSKPAVETSIHNSLKKLNTDYIDIILIHSNGNDLDIINNTPVLETLANFKKSGKILAYGLSGKTAVGAMECLKHADLAMITLNLSYQDELSVIDFATQHKKDILIKKGLNSGNINNNLDIKNNMEFIFKQDIASLVIGTINPINLANNVKMALQSLASKL